MEALTTTRPLYLVENLTAGGSATIEASNAPAAMEQYHAEHGTQQGDTLRVTSLPQAVTFAIINSGSQAHLTANGYPVARFERYTMDLTPREQVRTKMERLALLPVDELRRLVWANTSPDYKSDGAPRTLLHYDDEHGTCSMMLEMMTAPVLLKHLLYAKV